MTTDLEQGGQGAEMTTSQVMSYLGVSRSFVVKLMNEGVLPYRSCGSHRKIKLADVLKYEEESNKRSREALDELVKLSQELGLYDV